MLVVQGRQSLKQLQTSISISKWHYRSVTHMHSAASFQQQRSRDLASREACLFAKQIAAELLWNVRVS